MKFTIDHQHLYSFSVINYCFKLIVDNCIFFYFALMTAVFYMVVCFLSLLRRGISTMTEPGLYSVAYVTVPNENVAKDLAHGIVSSKLAACVNIIPKIKSVYEWEGKILEDDELLLMLKTRTSKVDELTNYVKKHHPYSICEVISIPIQNGNPDYLKWISDVVPA